jgi:hypothetical protein
MATEVAQETRPSGHLQVKGDRGRRNWYALWRDANGRRQKRLGLAHVKDSGRRTPRGAIVWRAADGPKPDPSYLSPAEAQDELRKLLADAAREPTDPRHRRDQDRTLAEACDAWLGYVELEKALRPSTVRDYRNAVGCYLLPEFGTTTLLRTIDTRRIDAYRERLLTEGELSRRTIQKILVQLYSILKRAKRKGWIAANPAEDAGRVTVRRTGEFNVLSPEEVQASRAPSRPSFAPPSTSPPPSRACGWASCGRCAGPTSTSPSACCACGATSPPTRSGLRSPDGCAACR